MEIKVQRLSLWMINTVFLLSPINNHQTNTINSILKSIILTFDTLFYNDYIYKNNGRATRRSILNTCILV